MREIRTSGATRGEVALRVLPYSTVDSGPHTVSNYQPVVFFWDPMSRAGPEHAVALTICQDLRLCQRVALWGAPS